MSDEMSDEMSRIVNAKDIVAGQWYIVDIYDGKLLCLGCRANRVWAEKHETIYLADLDELIHLPNCDGWHYEIPEPTKKYRPFATWQEWWPNRNRWVKIPSAKREDGCITLASWSGAMGAASIFKRGGVFIDVDGVKAEPFGMLDE